MIKQAIDARTVVQWIGFFAGPAFAIACFFLLPDSFWSSEKKEWVGFSWAGRMTLSVMVWMGVWWLTETVHVTITALLPLVLFPLLGVAEMKSTSAPYANPFIFLFLGGFLLALSMQRWGLDKRIALNTLRLVGTSPRNMIAGFMVATAVLSAFVSNTATTAMMLPIALSVSNLVKRQSSSNPNRENGQKDNFSTCLMLGIAYSASIGGVATIIGTPPNVFLISFINKDIATGYQMEISFVRWMLIGATLAVVFLPLAYILLTRFLVPVRITAIEGGKQLIDDEILKLDRPGAGEWITFSVFLSTVTCWILRPWLTGLSFEMGGQQYSPLSGLTDTGIVMVAAMLLFIIPVDLKKRTFVMDWQTARTLPWGILLLFGGGLSLAAAVSANGVAEFIGSQVGLFKDLPQIVVVLLVTTGIVFLTELTSNTATSASLIPVLAAIAPGIGLHPFLLIVPAALAASCAFMLPVATPPNAIVFGSGTVTIGQMSRAGLWLNLVSVVLITILTFAVIKPVLGIR
ncbi:DASS family sodium-coupled anion symporter [Vicingaceae bacterium]|nr:DASS family sodium-coupled anion symporter [Vicingaceae bacterium]